MRSVTIALVIFVLVFGSALATMFVSGVLSESQFSVESKEIIRISIALITTMLH